MPQDVETSRRSFRRLLAANPNHFGTLRGLDLSDLFPVIEPKQSDTGYEEIGCVSYIPERDRLEATVVLKRSAGYGGGPCTPGSVEWVRFFVDFGSGWVDAGSGAARVFDVPLDKDCAGAPDHPYFAVVGVTLAPLRRFCLFPQLPRVRAILSWEVEPTAGDPDFPPVWGEVQEDTVQIRPRRRFFPWDLGDLVSGGLTLDLGIDPKKLAALLESEDLTEVVPEPDPIGPVALNPQPLPPRPERRAPFSVEKLARLYSPDKLTVLAERAVDRRTAKLALDPVPPHRMAAAEATAATSGVVQPFGLATASLTYKKLDLDWGKILDLLDDGKGDTTYEELECLGLDDAAGQLVATYRVKRPTGFSGPPCSPGSTEHVAFWVDFDDDCTYTYLGTVEVAAHDYIAMPGSGLSYAAILPLDLASYRRLCREPGLHRVRAVLSWGTPPSTTDPDAVPHWGNRLDTHVHVLPGRPYDGVARLTIVGGVATAEIDPSTGVTLPVAHIAYNGAVLDTRGCPFAGRVAVHGPTDPALAGATYRLLSRNVTAGGTEQPVLTAFFVVDSGGFGSWVTPGASGWVSWPVWSTNTLGTLGYIDTSGDDLWEVWLELQGSGVVDTQRFQLDNTLNTASVDPANAAHLAFDFGQISQQNCGKFTQGMVVEGTYDARDTWFGSWGFSLLPFPLPTGSLTTSVALSTSEAPVGSTWQLDTSGLQPCGYVLRLSVSDRAIVHSVTTGRTVYVDIGFCIE
ncbi:hypothetical protein [Cellulomonas fimi]|uniref:Uncharacterized protein n=1 Tax=Cellulomonas fimi TaxID=1708 RepID=A0A7Y0QH35_CELFI|nr:hypothetical protein [Cellulomonas fimi]NMR19469.1 hypothetical protein [Cellulomonas fimi]